MEPIVSQNPVAEPLQAIELKVAVISDIHTYLNQIIKRRNFLPEADVFIFPGDMTYRGTPEELTEWRRLVQKHFLDKGRKVVAIAGNHELGVEAYPNASLGIINPQPDQGFFWLHDSLCEIDGFTFWGSPYTPWFCDWAFNIRTEEELQTHWDTCPEKVDCMITHGPPKGILDMTHRGQHVGSTSLRDTVAGLKPQLHTFGHIHEAYGVRQIGGVTYINASICTTSYNPINEIPVFILRR